MPNSTAIMFGLALGLSACAVTPAPETAAPVGIGGPAVVLDGQRHLEYRVGANIQASPEKVWALLTDGPNFHKWNSTVISIGGEIAAGQQIKLKAKVDPKRTYKLTVSTFEPNEKMVWEDGGKAFRGVRTFTLTAKDDGSTDVTMVEALGGSMMGMIEGKLPDFRPSFDGFIGDLKSAAEAG